MYRYTTVPVRYQFAPVAVLVMRGPRSHPRCMHPLVPQEANQRPSEVSSAVNPPTTLAQPNVSPCISHQAYVDGRGLQIKSRDGVVRASIKAALRISRIHN